MNTRTTIALLAFVLLAVGPARAELPEDEFEGIAKRADKAMKEPGSRDLKIEWIQKLGSDDRVRSVELLVEWATRTARLRLRELEPALAEAREDLEDFETILKKTHPWPPKTLPQDTKKAWDRKKLARDHAQQLVDTEWDVRFELARALEKTREDEAVDWLLKKGLKRLRRAEGAENAVQAVILAFTHASSERVAKALLEAAEDEKDPASRVLALEWIGRTRPEGGFEAAVEALEAKQDAVRRAGVASLKAMDDPRAVEPLIDALLDARGLIAVEIEAVLHYFTGESFLSSHAFWKKWWDENGEDWLAGRAASERHETKEERKGGTYFYGLRTDSDRIVFVLDRSGSMATAASPDSKEAEGAEIEGDTKIEVARSQLRRSIRTLPREVHFNILFYSDDVEAWHPAPDMLEADEENRAEAEAWVAKIDAAGSTQMFDALLAALAYADNFDMRDPSRGGCDTIFLMSDGSPTHRDSGQVLSDAEIEEAWTRVKEANRVYRCVIHTVGVGPHHNRALMQRIARETGGTYQAVGR